MLYSASIEPHCTDNNGNIKHETKTVLTIMVNFTDDDGTQPSLY